LEFLILSAHASKKVGTRMDVHEVERARRHYGDLQITRMYAKNKKQKEREVYFSLVAGL
jgi:hypothetical protein